MLRVGDRAPGFAAQDQDGELRTLDALRGQHVVLFFYPADETPGCTAEACAFRDEAEALRAAGVAVLGVSTQGVASHARFAARHGLPYPLLADVDKALCKAYGALGLLGVAKRVTYLIAPDGRIARVWQRVSPAGHAREVLAALQPA
ncbi:MAG: peroxiredoxin [Halobacteriales archaeon]|nr:peroxiredoxin [Halobacteriales archaeon]